MSDERETVAVVVVTYNRAALLTRMLAGLAALEHRPDAVIVVDNASTDHTSTVLETVHDLPLQVIRTEENLGGAAVDLTDADLAEIETALAAVEVQGHRYNEAMQSMIDR